MARYGELEEQVIFLNPDGSYEPAWVANPRAPGEWQIEMPLGDYEDLRVRTALVRSPDYGDHDPVTIGGSNDVYKLMKSISVLPQEAVYSILLDRRNRVLGIHEVHIGSTSSAVMEPKSLFQAAIIANAPAFIIVHNHPSGNPELSVEDKAAAMNIQKVGDSIGIDLLDFLAIGAEGYRSARDQGVW